MRRDAVIDLEACHRVVPDKIERDGVAAMIVDGQGSRVCAGGMVTETALSGSWVSERDVVEFDHAIGKVGRARITRRRATVAELKRRTASDRHGLAEV